MKKLSHKEIQEAELNILVEFDKFCKKNIKYKTCKERRRKEPCQEAVKANAHPVIQGNRHL